MNDYIYPSLQWFIEQNIDKIESNQFSELYSMLNNEDDDITSRFTELMYSLGIDPLNFMSYIPIEYLAAAPIKDFKVPSHIRLIRSCAFKECMHLESVNFVANRTLTTIESEAFAYCKELRQLKLHQTSLQHVEPMLCYSCEKLEKVTLPSTVKIIDSLAFFNCKKLKEIIVPKSVVSISKDAFNSAYMTKFVCMKGSYADKYAEEHDIPCEYV